MKILAGGRVSITLYDLVKLEGTESLGVEVGGGCYCLGGVATH